MAFKKCNSRINDICKELKESFRSRIKKTELKECYLLQLLTEIKGGTSHNVTPKECETTFLILEFQ